MLIEIYCPSWKRLPKIKSLVCPEPPAASVGQSIGGKQPLPPWTTLHVWQPTLCSLIKGDVIQTTVATRGFSGPVDFEIIKGINVRPQLISICTRFFDNWPPTVNLRFKMRTQCLSSDPTGFDWRSAHGGKFLNQYWISQCSLQ